MEITSAALSISIALVIFGISYYFFTTRHKERMTLIQKGLPPGYFKNSTNYLPLILTLGAVSIGISLGIIAGALFKLLPNNALSAFAFPFTIFLFLGISLLVSYFILKRMSK